MPPLRTPIDFTTKVPIKTERTHEENQERAYIAASRRSDRSLEARVESARRASEIHKRRTGSSLRVTEQDVINEEMYEEEDDDLPMQYRRLTAHLQTSNADFDRRLAAYLTNHVAMRTALGQAVSNSYHQNPRLLQPQHQHLYANAPTFASPSLLGTPPTTSSNSPPLSAGAQQSANSVSPTHNESTKYNISQYPLATQQAFQAAMHGRSASVANHLSTLTSLPQNVRRGSMPVQNSAGSGSTTALRPADGAQPSKGMANLKLPADKSATAQQQPPSMFPSGFQSANAFGEASLAPNGPLTTALPLESQQLLGGALDPNDPMTSLLMGGPQAQQQPFYSYNPNSDSKSSFSNWIPNRAWGIQQTLSPGVMDSLYSSPVLSPQDSCAQRSNSCGHDSAISSIIASGSLDNPGSTATHENDFLLNRPSVDDSFSGTSTPHGTPSFEKDWQNLFDGNLWEEQQSSSQQASSSTVAA